MKRYFSTLLAALVLCAGTLMAAPVIESQVIKKNGNVILTMSSDVPFVLVGTSDFVNFVVLKEYKNPKNHAVYIDNKRQANEPYFFYFVAPLQ